MSNILIIAGFDPSGGGGIIADQRAALFCGVVPFTVLTAITAQNTYEISLVNPLEPHVISSQLKLLFNEFTFDAVKIGMVGTSQNAAIIAKFLSSAGQKNIILDPVVSSTSGGPLLTPAKKESLAPLLNITSLITPNLKETQFLTGIPICNTEDMVKAGRLLFNEISGSVLIKGGHLSGDPEDLLITPENEMFFRSKRINTGEIRGTGCWLSTLITSRIAQNMTLEDAVSDAVKVLRKKIKNTIPVISKNGIII